MSSKYFGYKCMYLQQLKNTRVLRLDMLASQHLAPKVLNNDEHIHTMDWGDQGNRPSFDLSVKGWKVESVPSTSDAQGHVDSDSDSDLPPF